ncbi:MAG: hypothetical protein JSV79_03825 [Armatimonadota bacterium]|nr:MAG: hypothetical protein JSV79_03825 [Armatimonadota bacterium]
MSREGEPYRCDDCGAEWSAKAYPCIPEGHAKLCPKREKPDKTLEALRAQHQINLSTAARYAYAALTNQTPPPWCPEHNRLLEECPLEWHALKSCPTPGTCEKGHTHAGECGKPAVTIVDDVGERTADPEKVKEFYNDLAAVEWKGPDKTQMGDLRFSMQFSCGCVTHSPDDKDNRVCPEHRPPTDKMPESDRLGADDHTPPSEGPENFRGPRALDEIFAKRALAAIDRFDPIGEYDCDDCRYFERSRGRPCRRHR